MHTAESLTRQIVQAVDLVDTVSRHVKLTRAGKEWRGLCPFHKEKTASFYVVPAKQIFKCFGCGAGGDVIKFFQLRDNLSFLEARRVLAERAGIRLDDPASRRPGEPDRADLARVNDWARRWFVKQLEGTSAGRAANEYALKRGLSPQTIEKYAIGYGPEASGLVSAAAMQRIEPKLLLAAGLVKQSEDGRLYDAFRHRLIFPIRDAMDRTIGFGGRALGDDKAKYLNTAATPLFDKSRALYGIEIAKGEFSKAGCAIIVEGYLDCLLAHQNGFGHAVATLGTALTETHIDLLRRYTDAVVLVFDSDEAGRRAADRVLPLILTQRIGVKIANVPEGKDPCDYLTLHGAAAFDLVLKSGVEALKFKWNSTLSRYHAAEGGPGRIRAVEEFLDLVAQAARAGAIDEIQRGLVVNQIAGLLGIEPREIHHRFAATARRPAPNVAAEAPVADVTIVIDAIGAATRELLEVLINEPGYYPSVADHFDPRRLPPPAGRVGELVVSLAQELGEFDLRDLLCRIEDDATARVAIALQEAGERRGNYAAAVEGAISRLQQEGQRDRTAALKAAFRPSQDSSDELDARARAESEAMRQHRHFLPSKLARNRGGRIGASQALPALGAPVVPVVPAVIPVDGPQSAMVTALQ